MVQQVLAPSSKGFLYALLTSSFSFYLFSFQVHEKSILLPLPLPLLPLTLLALEEGRSLLWLTHFAMFSMIPLLHGDKLILAYMALYALFILVYFAPGGRSGRYNGSKTLDHSQKTKRGMELIFFHCFPPACNRLSMFVLSDSACYLSLGLCSLILHAIYLTMHPPSKYPFLFEAVIVLICFFQFLYFNSKQWMLSQHLTWKDKQKKLV